MDELLFKWTEAVFASVEIRTDPNGFCDCRSASLLDSLLTTYDKKAHVAAYRRYSSMDFTQSLHSIQTLCQQRCVFMKTLQHDYYHIPTESLDAIDIPEILREHVVDGMSHVKHHSIHLDMDGDNVNRKADCIVDKPSQILRTLRLVLRDFLGMLITGCIAVQIAQESAEKKAAKLKLKKSKQQQQQQSDPPLVLEDVGQGQEDITASSIQISPESLLEIQGLTVAIVEEVSGAFAVLRSCLSPVPAPFESKPAEWLETLDLVVAGSFGLKLLHSELIKTGGAGIPALEEYAQQLTADVAGFQSAFKTGLHMTFDNYVLEDVYRQEWQSNSPFRKGRKVSGGVFMLAITTWGLLSDLTALPYSLDALRGSEIFAQYEAFRGALFSRLHLDTLVAAVEVVHSSYSELRPSRIRSAQLKMDLQFFAAVIMQEATASQKNWQARSLDKDLDCAHNDLAAGLVKILATVYFQSCRNAVFIDYVRECFRNPKLKSPVKRAFPLLPFWESCEGAARLCELLNEFEDSVNSFEQSRRDKRYIHQGNCCYCGSQVMKPKEVHDVESAFETALEAEGFVVCSDPQSLLFDLNSFLLRHEQWTPSLEWMADMIGRHPCMTLSSIHVGSPHEALMPPADYPKLNEEEISTQTALEGILKTFVNAAGI